MNKLINKISCLFVLLPIILVLVVSSFNLDKKISLKLLVWETAELRLGTLLTIGASLGYISSFLILSTDMNKKAIRRSRVVKKNIKTVNTNQTNGFTQETDIKQEIDSNQDYYLERDVRDPSPTISIPFRVINKRSRSVDISNQPEVNYNNRYNNESIQENTDNNNIDNGWAQLNLENW